MSSNKPITDEREAYALKRIDRLSARIASTENRIREEASNAALKGVAADTGLLTGLQHRRRLDLAVRRNWVRRLIDAGKLPAPDDRDFGRGKRMGTPT